MRQTGVGIALVSLSTLALQLTLTRLFSATMHYHFAFLAISLALFGSAASGVALYWLGSRVQGIPTSRLLARASILFAATTVLALLVILASPISPVDPPARTFWRLAFIYSAAAVPFFCAGAAITIAVTRYASEIARLYLFDLAGAAAGCLCLIPALDVLGAVNTVLAVAATAALAAIVFDTPTEPARAPSRSLRIAAALIMLLLPANAVGRWVDVRVAKGVVERQGVIFSKWNSFSRVTVWGDLEAEHVTVMIDADAATLLDRDASETAKHVELVDGVEALVHALRPKRKVLILGAGAGRDVIRARLFGATDITAVELNPIIARDIARGEPFRTYSGALFDQPGVHLVVDEGRSFVRSSKERFDVIQATMVDTWAATAAGAFALAENNLYTVESFQDYLDHLRDDGLLSMTRWYFQPPDQLLRLVALAQAALIERGQSAADRILLVRGDDEEEGRAPATFLMKKSAFTPSEIEAAHHWAELRHYEVLYSPARRPANEFTRLLEGTDPAALSRELKRNIRPPRDDSPFFFQAASLLDLREARGGAEEWSKTNLGTFVLAVLIAIAFVATLMFVLVPLALSGPRLGPLPFGRALRHVLYFACLGLGFILIEVVLVQKCVLLLGHPTYALAVVLFSLLLFSGIGSRLTGLISSDQLPRRLVAVLLTLVALVVVASLALSPAFAALAPMARPWRIAACVALLAPLGLLMGMPMPLGIRRLAADLPVILPWAWGVNGAASVFGSAAALVLAMTVGFNAALLIGGLFYLLAFVLTWTSKSVIIA
jgi:predicted membrane-bound spermidine synthase